MTPEECRAIAERVRETLARARYLAGRGAAAQAMAAELIVIADDLCSRARAERERAQELAFGQVATPRAQRRQRWR